MSKKEISLEDAIAALAKNSGKDFSEVEKMLKYELSKQEGNLTQGATMLDTHGNKIVVAKPKQLVLSATRVHNPSIMEPVKMSGLYKHLKFKEKWEQYEVDGKKKRRKVKIFDGLVDYPENKVAELPVHSPIKKYVDEGKIRFCRIAQVGQDNKPYKGQKYEAYKEFQRIIMDDAIVGDNKMIAIPPDWKDTELQIFYGTPQQIADLFNITVEKMYASIDKLHKWLKLLKTPTKVIMNSTDTIKVLYIEEPKNQYGKDSWDGDALCVCDLEVLKAGGGMMWDGFCEFMQFRSFIDTGVLMKGLVSFNAARFFRKSKWIKEKYGIKANKYHMIINQHTVKFDNIGLEDGKIYEFPAHKLFRFINARFKPGTSTLGAQLVAMNDMQVAKGILMEHSLIESATLIKSLAKGLPFAWMHIANDYKKISTNKFVELMFCVKRPQYGWRMSKVYSKHNQNVSFLEAEWRKRISSLQVNTESAYAYTDERCDTATLMWHDRYGEWKSFAVVPRGTELNSKGEVATIKYPLHSGPCIASHFALKEDIFDPESPLVEPDEANEEYKEKKLLYGPHGGLGLSTMYQRSVKGLDADGDKLAKFVTEYSIPVDFDLTVEEEGEKPAKVVIDNILSAVEHLLENSKKAAADTSAIGQIDLAIRYCFISAHLAGHKLTPYMMSMIGELREGGIKGGVKGAGETKGIAATSTHLDIAASLEAGTLQQDVINWFAQVTGFTPKSMSQFGELDPNNLAEISHYLVVKGAGCKSKSHGEKFIHRIQKLLPAYIAHKGDKSNNPWNDALVEMHAGIKEEYLTFDKNDSKIHQEEYKACWDTLNRSYNYFQPRGEWDYSFDLEQVKGMANWIRAFYTTNANGIYADYRGVEDRETGEVLHRGDYDKDRFDNRYLRLNRIVKFMLYGLKPHNVDLEFMPKPTIPANVLERIQWLSDFTGKNQHAYLKFMQMYVGSVDFNTKGERGNSGGIVWSFPATVTWDVRDFYYTSTERGKKEERNPFLDLTKPFAVKFDTDLIARWKEWLEKNPYADEYDYVPVDADNFEEEELAHMDDQFGDDEYDYEEQD